MAKKRPAKGPADRIKEREEVNAEIHACPACGKPVEPDAATCPHCGTALDESIGLQAQAAELLLDLGKHLEAAAEAKPGASPPATPAAPDSASAGLGSAADVAATLGQPAPTPPARAGPAPDVAAEPEPAPEPITSVEEGEEAGPEAGESRDLEGFIKEIEAEMGRAPAPAPKSPPHVRAVPREEAARRSTRWVAAVAAGALLYFLALLAFLPLMGKLAGASAMVLGSVLVAVGISLRPGAASPSPNRAARAEGTPDYVCPLCGTGIPARASECPTCGALFED